jgi:hypothetical protein
LAPFVRVTGLTELRAALKTVSAEAPKDLAKANKRAAMIVAVEAEKRAPKGPHEGGGKVVPISKSIHGLLSANKVTVAAGGARSPHAAGAEFGGYIPRRGFKGKKAYAKKLTLIYGGHTVTHLKQQPYLLPAITAKLDEVIDAYRGFLDDVANRIRKGA